MNSRLVIFSVLSITLLATGIGAVYFYKNRDRLSPEQIYAIAQEKEEKREYSSAYSHYGEAARLAPNNSDYHYAHAKIAYKLRQNEVALASAERAWELGVKDYELVNMMINLKRGKPNEVYEYSMKLIKNIDLEPNVLTELKARIELRNSQFAKAEALIKELFKKDPTTSRLKILTRSILGQNKVDEALTTLEEWRKTKLMDLENYEILINIYRSKDEVKKVAELFDEVESQNMMVPAMVFAKAWSAFDFGDLVKAEVEYKKLLDPHLISLMQIGEIEEWIVSNQDQWPYTKLDQATKSILLNKDKSEHQKRCALSIALNNLTAQEGFLTDSVESRNELAGDWISNSKAAKTDAERKEIHWEAITTLYPTVFFKQQNLFTDGSRLFLTFIYTKLRKPDDLKQLANYRKGESKWNEGEVMLEGLILNPPKEMAQVEKSLDNVSSLLNAHPIIELIRAEQKIQLNKGKDALEIIKNILKNNPKFNRNPQLLITQAKAHAILGNEKLSAALLQAMHQRKIFSKESLLMFRNLMISVEGVDKGLQVQKLMNEIYKEDADILWEDARMSVQARDFDKASAAINKLAEKFPDNLEVEFMKFSLLIDQKKLTEFWENLKKTKLQDEQKTLLKAQAYTVENKLKEAMAAYESLTSENLVARSKLPLMRLYLATNAFDKAEPIIDEVLRENKNAHAMFSKARILINQRNPVEALEWINQSIAMEPKNIAYASLKSLIVFQLGKHQEALSLSEDILKQDPNLKDVQRIRVQAQLALKDYFGAKKTLENLLAKNNDDLVLQSYMVRSLVGLELVDKAINLLEGLINKNKEAHSLKDQKLAILISQKKYADALKYLDQIGSFFNEDYVLLNKANITDLKGESKVAAGMLQTKLDNPRFKAQWALYSIKAGESDVVIKELEKSSLAPIQSLALGQEALAKKNYVLAYEIYKLGLKVSEKNMSLLNNLAWVSTKVENVNSKEAISLAQKAYEIAPNNINVLDTYFYVLSSQGSYSPLIEVAQKQMGDIENHSNILYYLAQAYEGEKDLDSAKLYYTKAMEVQVLNPKNDFPTKIDDVQAKVNEIEQKIIELKKKKKQD